MPRPTLPRIRRRTRGPAGQVAERAEPRISELSANGLPWLQINEPGPPEAAVLAERFGFHELDIEDVLSKRQRPKIDEYPDYLFVVLHFPFYDKVVQRLNAAELDMFVGPDFLITLPNVELHPVTYLFTRCESDVELRDEIFKGRSEEVVRDISNAKQEIIAYRKIIKPERATLRVLERHMDRFIPEDSELYFGDIVDAAERVWDQLDNFKEVIEGLESTNESFIAHRQQYRLQILTVTSVILLPLTLIASIFGMNVLYPGEGTHEAFWLILGMIVALGVALLAVFRWRRW